VVHMRRHPPRCIELSHDDHHLLLRLVRDGRTEQRVARRARILLAMADGATVVDVLAQQVGQSRQTIWNVCRRYEQVGVEAVFDAERAGRPRQFSPP
jgi:transposase